MNTQKPRVWISNNTPEKGEIVRVRAVVIHRMETGFRLNQDGEAITRNIINSFIATFNDQPLFTWEPETAISQNPYLEFTFVAKNSGTLSLRWEDDEKNIMTSDNEITLAD